MYVNIHYNNLLNVNVKDELDIEVYIYHNITCWMCEGWRMNKDMEVYIYLYINLACLSVCLFVCLFVCLYPINVKTAEPIGPKFCVGHLGTPGKVYEWSKFQIFVSIKIRSSLNFWKFWKSTKFFLWKSANYFCFVLRCTQREHVHN